MLAMKHYCTITVSDTDVAWPEQWIGAMLSWSTIAEICTLQMTEDHFNANFVVPFEDTVYTVVCRPSPSEVAKSAKGEQWTNVISPFGSGGGCLGVGPAGR